jgi:hypothetical protein
MRLGGKFWVTYFERIGSATMEAGVLAFVFGVVLRERNASIPIEVADLWKYGIGAFVCGLVLDYFGVGLSRRKTWIFESDQSRGPAAIADTVPSVAAQQPAPSTELDQLTPFGGG